MTNNAMFRSRETLDEIIPWQTNASEFRDLPISNNVKHGWCIQIHINRTLPLARFFGITLLGRGNFGISALEIELVRETSQGETLGFYWKRSPCIGSWNHFRNIFHVDHRLVFRSKVYNACVSELYMWATVSMTIAHVPCNEAKIAAGDIILFYNPLSISIGISWSIHHIFSIQNVDVWIMQCHINKVLRIGAMVSKCVFLGDYQWECR